MKVIETVNSWNSFFAKDVIVIPIFADTEKHAMNNFLSLLYVYSIVDNVSYIIAFNHSETSSLDYSILLSFPKKVDKIYTFNKKELLTIFGKIENIYDLNILNYLKNGESIFFDDLTPAHLYIHRKKNIENHNRIIPVSKHVEICEKLVGKIKPLVGDNFIESETYSFYNNEVITNLYEIEKNGLKVDKKIFSKFYYQNHVSVDNFVFTEYNIYTSTGRPSNRHGNVNYAALPKKDESRKSFISRFGTNGALTSFDYEAYHLHLIAELIGFDLPKENIHAYLGKQYFGKDSLTQKEYEESKVKSFEYLYGGSPKEIQNKISFFRDVAIFTNEMWQRVQNEKLVESPYSRKKIYLSQMSDPTPQKFFNYFIQLMESERNFIIMSKINNYLENYETKLVLYMYDAFIFDYSFADGKEFIFKVKDILEENGKFPTKVEAGYNFHDLMDITAKFN